MSAPAVTNDLQKIIDALQLAQRHDTLQTFKVFKNGKCMAVYAGGTITFDSLQKVYHFLDYAGVAPVDLYQFDVVINHAPKKAA
jgi:hypothetical protein